MKPTYSAALILYVLSACLSLPQKAPALDGENLPDFFKEMLNGLENTGERIRRNERHIHEQIRANNEEMQRLLSRGAAHSDPRIQQLQFENEMNRNSLEGARKIENWAGDFVTGILNDQKQIYLNKQQEKMNLRAQAQQAFIENQGLEARHKLTLEALFNPEHLKRAAYFLGSSALLLGLGYFTSKLMYEYCSEQIKDKPLLVRKTTSKSRFTKAWERIFGSKPPTRSLNEIVLTPELETDLHAIASDLQESYKNNLPLQNLIFYGPPGTGKTEFAQILSDISGLDFAFISGPDFRQFQHGEGVTQVHKLFKWLNNGDRPRLLFIDEADAAFPNRKGLDREGIDIINAFLSHTGAPTKRFMFILATNHPENLDRAVRSRISKEFAFDLPAEAERIKIIHTKLVKYIVTYLHTYELNGKTQAMHITLDPAITTEFIATQNKKMNNFSGRDIEQAVVEMQIRACRSGTMTLTREIFEKVINDKVKQVNKNKEIDRYQEKIMTFSA